MSTTQLRVAFRYFKIGTIFLLKWSSLLRHPHFACNITQMYKAGLAEDCITNLLIAYEWQNLYHLYLKVNTGQKLQNLCPQIAKCDFKIGPQNRERKRTFRKRLIDVKKYVFWRSPHRRLTTLSSTALNSFPVKAILIFLQNQVFYAFQFSKILWCQHKVT